MKKFGGYDLSKTMESEFDIDSDDAVKVSQDMVVVDTTAPSEIKGRELSIDPQDAIEDYTIVRTTLHETLEQTQEILKTAAALIKDDPNAKNIQCVTDLIKSHNMTTEKLFDLHIKISNQVGKKDADDEEAEEFSINDIINQKDNE